MIARHRLEALSDGIFAVAMTLCVIDLKVPEGLPHGHLMEALRQERASWLAFAITFGIAARYWVLQNRVFAIAEKLHRKAVPLTIIFLGLVTTLPFTTALMSRYASDRDVFSLYCLNQALIGVVLIIKLEFICHHGHNASPPNLRSLRARLWSLALAMAIAGVSSYILPMRFVFYLPALIIILLRQAYRDRPADALSAQ